jgi:hypothetical protein
MSEDMWNTPTVMADAIRQLQQDLATEKAAREAAERELRMIKDK